MYVITILRLRGKKCGSDINFLTTYREESRKFSISYSIYIYQRYFIEYFNNLFDLLYRARSGKASKSDNANQANQMNEMNHVTWMEHFKPRLDTSDMSSALDASRDRVQEIHKVQQVREGY